MTTATLKKQVVVFTDFDLNFTKHPVTNDIVTVKNDICVKRSIRNLLLTRHYARPFHSEIGCNLEALLFNPISPLLTNALKKVITETITEFEPRVKIYDIEVNYETDNNTVNITIHFIIVNTNKPLTVEIAIQRSR